MNVKQTVIRLLRSRLAIGIEICLVLVFIVAVGQEVVRRKNVEDEVIRLESQISELEQNNVHLADVLKEMTSDNYLEKEARKKLDVQRPGETVVLLPKPDEEGQIVLTSDEETNRGEEESNATRWWEYFFNLRTS